MMILDTINSKIAQALKAKDEIRLSTLRLLLSALNYEFIAKQHQLSAEEEWAVVKRETRKRKEAIEAYRQVKETVKIKERVEREKKELEILKEFLPKEIADDELQKIIKKGISKLQAGGSADMGKVIGFVMGQVKGRADGGRVARFVKEKLATQELK